MRVKQPVMCFECGKRVTLTKAGNFKKHSNPKTGDTCVRYGLPPKKPSKE